MVEQPYMAIAAQYGSEEEAVADFDQIYAHYKHAGRHAAFDAAVVVRDEQGAISILKTHERAKHHGAGKGLAIGLAGGLVVALFPAIALGGALLVGGGAGAGIGAIAGHIANTLSAEDLRTIGQVLDSSSAGVVLVVEPADSDEVQSQLAHAQKVTPKEITVDDEELERALQEAWYSWG